MSLPKRIEITEVGPRDGWQNHNAMIIPTEVKAKYVKKMIDAGADIQRNPRTDRNSH